MNKLSRRDVLKLAGGSAALAAVRPALASLKPDDWPIGTLSALVYVVPGTSTRAMWPVKINGRGDSYLYDWSVTEGGTVVWSRHYPIPDPLAPRINPCGEILLSGAAAKVLFHIHCNPYHVADLVNQRKPLVVRRPARFPHFANIWRETHAMILDISGMTYVFDGGMPMPETVGSDFNLFNYWRLAWSGPTNVPPTRFIYHNTRLLC